MAKKNDDLFDKLRSAGLRKRVARTVSQGGSASEKAARKVLSDLQSASEEIRSRVTGASTTASRAEAARKAARTRKRKAAARSASAKKAAATRAKKKSGKR